MSHAIYEQQNISLCNDYGVVTKNLIITTQENSKTQEHVFEK